MRLLTSSIFLSVHTFVLLSNALPFSEFRNETQFMRRRAPYSVVPVDGGQPDGSATPKTQIVTKDSTRTVTEPPKTMPPKTMPPVTETILSTTLVTESEVPTTVVATITTKTTPLSTPLSTQAPAPDTALSVTTDFMTLASLMSTATTVSVITTSAPGPTPYDNGMWHTTYYKPAEPLPSDTGSTSATDETSAAVNDVQFATFTGVPSNGTYALTLRGRKKQRSSVAYIDGTNSTSMAAAATETKPQMPTLPRTSALVNPAAIPSIDIAKHQVPGFDI